MLILTIESSCDETSAAVIRDGRYVLSNAIASQIPVHRRYGGVVPELASRSHILDIHAVIDDSLAAANVSLEQIEAIGVTSGPGLVGSLLVGIETAKALAFGLNVPCLGLNHLEGHLTAVLLEIEGLPQPKFPYIGLVASGGHSDLYLVEAIGSYKLLGRTRDDAAGEAFDKVAKMLGLPYPGGVEIDALAAKGRRDAIDFPRPMWTRQHLDFSFAGLKTAVLNHVQANGVPTGQGLYDLCASFQAAVVDVLVMKTLEAAKQHDAKQIVISGGVACNSELRREMALEAKKRFIEVLAAPPKLCTDNAAMLGPIAHHYALALIEDGEQGFESFDLCAQTGMPLGKSVRPKKQGRHR